MLVHKVRIFSGQVLELGYYTYQYDNIFTKKIYEMVIYEMVNCIIIRYILVDVIREIFLVDIDECVESTSLCSQVCTNTQGSYNCSCADGYELQSDLVSCEGTTHFFYTRVNQKGDFRNRLYIVII